MAAVNSDTVNVRGSEPAGQRLFAIAHIPVEAKKLANTPSSTIIRQINFTIEAVVSGGIEDENSVAAIRIILPTHYQGHCDLCFVFPWFPSGPRGTR